MTAPVHTEPRAAAASDAAAADSDAAAAAPAGMKMAFFLPSKYTSLEQLPRPNNPLVRLVEVPAKRYAVVTFSGLVGDEKVTYASLHLSCKPIALSVSFSTPSSCNLALAAFAMFSVNSF